MTPVQHHSATRTHERLPPFRSFWMTAFDSADHARGLREALDLLQYRRRVEADYRAVRDAGIACVRESIDWRRAARDDRFDFTTVALRAECARRVDLQIVWTLCNAGAPEGIDVCSGAFVDRFRAFAKAAARVTTQSSDAAPPVYVPIDEISFQSFAIAETGLFGEQRRELHLRGRDVMRQLVRATLAACDAILEVEPRARFLHTEPVVNAPRAGTEDSRERNRQFDVWDMLAGRLDRELGGHPRYLDIAGIHHHYIDPRWRGAAAPDGTIAGDATRFALHRLLEEVHARYGRPLVVCETNHVSAVRATWLRELGDEIGEALMRGIPVLGACLCRAVERPTWEDPRYWRGRRLWDRLLQSDDDSPRVPDSAYGRALRDVQARIDPLLVDPQRRHSP